MRIVVGVTGGIAAYKAAEIVRRLIKAGCAVQVIMTDGAKAFVTSLTFQALSGNPVRDTLLDPAAEMGMGHIELARWADAILIAPASANVIARLSAGMADDLLTTVVLASRAPVWIAPAMNQVMWENPLTQRNLATLCAVRQDVRVLGPTAGEQACGETGPGRLLEPDELVQAFMRECSASQLPGKRSRRGRDGRAASGDHQWTDP
jgi:phosphopantothenoylcysteine decarboxylase/phosphopantothenate--cysteine ligase